MIFLELGPCLCVYASGDWTCVLTGVLKPGIEELMEACQQQVEQQMRPVIEGLLVTTGLETWTTREVQMMALSVTRGVSVRNKDGEVVFLV